MLKLKAGKSDITSEVGAKSAIKSGWLNQMLKVKVTKTDIKMEGG